MGTSMFFLTGSSRVVTDAALSPSNPCPCHLQGNSACSGVAKYQSSTWTHLVPLGLFLGGFVDVTVIWEFFPTRGLFTDVLAFVITHLLLAACGGVTRIPRLPE